ncbi:MAG: glycosyltransferase, partial [Microcystis panniformis Mp_MB_F_20051200_S6D]
MRFLIFIVTYNASRKIVSVLKRIPPSLQDSNDVDILIIDDCSQDDTFDVAQAFVKEGFWCPVKVLKNPVNQGYGGNQKIGYSYAIERGYDVVALLHGDGQYAPELLPTLLEPFKSASPPGAVFGSRMISRWGALSGGMPLYKFVGNRILTYVQNQLLRSTLSEFHSGYRLYAIETLRRIPFHLNTTDFHFDTEIIVQLLFSRVRIQEVPIPTFYGDEISHVNGFAYAGNVIRSSIKARFIELGIFFDPKFEIRGLSSNKYLSKLSFDSTHRSAFDTISSNSVVLDLGCADGYLSEVLARDKGCTVVSVDVENEKTIEGCTYQSVDLNNSMPDVEWETLDYIVLLDVIEHLRNPEGFIEILQDKLSNNRKAVVIVSSGNVCFFVARLMMLVGQLNYGRRGILDITHVRL